MTQRKDDNKENAKEMNPKDKLAIYLNEALAIENAAVTRLQSRIKETNMQEAKQQLRHHLEETKEQQERLRELISNFGGKATKNSAKLLVPTPPKNISNALRRSITPAEEELKGAKEDAIIENAEVVMYDMMIQLAQQMNVSDAIPALSQNLNEEREMADWLRANTPVMLSKLSPEIQSSLASDKEGQAARIAEA